MKIFNIKELFVSVEIYLLNKKYVLAITCLLNTTVTTTIHDKYSREYSPQIIYHFPGYSLGSAVLLDVRHSGHATEGAIAGVDPSL